MLSIAGNKKNYAATFLIDTCYQMIFLQNGSTFFKWLAFYKPVLKKSINFVMVIFSPEFISFNSLMHRFSDPWLKIKCLELSIFVQNSLNEGVKGMDAFRISIELFVLKSIQPNYMNFSKLFPMALEWIISTTIYDKMTYSLRGTRGLKKKFNFIFSYKISVNILLFFSAQFAYFWFKCIP